MVGRNMETPLLATGTLSRLIVIKSEYYSDKGYAHYNENGYVLLGEERVFSTVVKIEAERATSNDKYVNLRFCNSNRYWARKADDNFIVAESKAVEEDTTKSSCTLFEAVAVDDSGLFYLVHVQSGGRLLFEEEAMRFVVNANPEPNQGYLRFVNWAELVKLPKKVALKGYNGKYLEGKTMSWQYVDRPFLQFSSDDPNKMTTSYEVTLMGDGHVRVLSNNFNAYWRRDTGAETHGWIWADSTDTTTSNNRNLFWPVKIDDNTIALKCADNGKFCQAVTSDWQKTDCLDASADTTSKEARLGVEELVIERKIFNVRYRMEDSRIYNETPFVAGTTTAENKGDIEANIAVAVEYKDEKSYSVSRSTSVTAGVSASIEFGIPLIEGASIEVSYEESTTLEWNTTTTTSTTVTATGSVPVPGHSVSTVNYVATMGTCDIPFSYTRQDRSSIDGSITETDEVDGVFKGVNAYNFHFVIDSTQPLPPDEN